MGLESFRKETSTSQSEYSTITKEDFDEFIESLPYDFKEKRTNNCREYIYELNNVVDGDPSIILRIYSTISVDTNESREKGKDAIRTVLQKRSTNKPVGGRTKTLRIPTWRKNLRGKIQSLVEDTKEHYNPCEECGSYLVKRSGKNGDFLGCLNYPDCDNTQSL